MNEDASSVEDDFSVGSEGGDISDAEADEQRLDVQAHKPPKPSFQQFLLAHLFSVQIRSE